MADEIKDTRTDEVALDAHAADDGAITASGHEAEAEEGESEDSLTFSNGVIEKIVAIAMRDVPGVVGMKGSWFNRVQGAFGVDDTTKGVSVEVTPESAVKVYVSVLMAYGSYAPQVFEDAKRAIVDAVRSMTGLEVHGVNLRIEDVLTPDEIERRQARARSVDAEAEPADAEAVPVEGQPAGE